MKKLFVFLACVVFVGVNFLQAQTVQITGTVTSAEDSMPIPGVSVQVMGTTIGVATDVEGKYILTAPASSSTLTFSFLGFKTQEVEISGQKAINIILESDLLSLDEIVVVGYGTAIKRELTGAIAKVETGEMGKLPSHSIETAIQGRASGVFVEQASGKLGETIKMRIRGASSISADNQPLYVVDGMPITSANIGSESNQPTSPLSDLSMTDIESIQVLKDASASAIYGSRASNGVVIITTKRGKAGQTSYNVNYSTGISNPSNLMDWLNASQYLELLNESIDNVTFSGDVWGEPGLTKADVLGWAGLDGTATGYNEDWQSLAFQKGTFNRVTLSASGGNNKTTFYTGLNYDDIAGILKGNNMTKLNARLNLDQKASDRFSFGMQMNINRSQMDRVENDNAFATPLQLVAQTPLIPAIDPGTGEYNTNTYYYNGLISLRDSHLNTTVFRSLANAYAEYTFFDGFAFRSEFGTDILDQRERNFWGRKTITGGPAGEAQDRAVRVVNYSWENYFTYNKAFGSHNLSAVGGASFQESNTIGNNIMGKGFPTDAFHNIASAAEASEFSGWEYGHSFLSYFARANYNFSQKYFFTLSGRVDGSSRFGVENRYGFFPAVSAGWILSEEDFMLGIKDHLNFLKLRASYGTTGNSGIPNYAHLALFSGINYAGRNGIEPIQLQSSQLGWEKTDQFDVGVDFGLFNSRITAEIDYYYKYTTDLLLYKTLPSTSGYTGVWSNSGTLENKGFEFAFRSNNLTGEFIWNTDFNIAFNRNKVLNANGASITPNSQNYVIEGQPIGVFKMRKYAGVDPDNGDALYYLNANSNETTNNYNLAESQIVGSPNPDFTGGLNNYLEYKGFDFSMLINFVYGNEIYRGYGTYLSANGDWFDNQTVDQMDRWQNPGDITDVPQARFGDGNGTQHSSRYLSDGSYLRLKNITIGYTLPNRISRRIKMSSMRVYLSALNLYTLTNYEGWDPEVNWTGTARSTQNQNIIQGQDFFTVPQARTFTVGVNLTF